MWLGRKITINTIATIHFATIINEFFSQMQSLTTIAYANEIKSTSKWFFNNFSYNR